MSFGFSKIQGCRVFCKIFGFNEIGLQGILYIDKDDKLSFKQEEEGIFVFLGGRFQKQNTTKRSAREGCFCSMHLRCQVACLYMHMYGSLTKEGFLN